MWIGHSYVVNLLEYENTKCPFCKDGHLRRDNSKYTKFRPYLVCDKCETDISLNLNLRNRNLSNKCPKCNNDLEEIHNLVTGESSIKCSLLNPKNEKCTYKKNCEKSKLKVEKIRNLTT